VGLFLPADGCGFRVVCEWGGTKRLGACLKTCFLSNHSSHLLLLLLGFCSVTHVLDLGLWHTSSSITNHLLWALQVGTSLGRCLTWDKTREVLVSSLSANASYITSTVLWVYWYGPRGPQNNYLHFSWKISSMHCLTEILLFAGTLLMLLLQLLILFGKIGSEVFLWLTSCCMFAGVSVSVTWYHSMLVE